MRETGKGRESETMRHEDSGAERARGGQRERERERHKSDRNKDRDRDGGRDRKRDRR